MLDGWRDDDRMSGFSLGDADELRPRFCGGGGRHDSRNCIVELHGLRSIDTNRLYHV